MTDFRISIIHDLPGRLRLRLNFSMIDSCEVVKSIGKHKGIDKVTFNHITRSLLILYQPFLIKSIEIIVRSAIVLSLENGNAPIEIYTERKEKPLKPLDYYAGIALLLALVGKTGLVNTKPNILEYHGAAVTSLSVINHAWQEIKEEGLYHPETLSAVYLINGIIKGNVLKASVLTWVVTFGRHILDTTGDTCVMKALEVQEKQGKKSIDAVVRSSSLSLNNPIMFGVKVLGNSMGIDAKGSRHSLMERITRMSREHGDVLEGLGEKSERVYMRINQ